MKYLKQIKKINLATLFLGAIYTTILLYLVTKDFSNFNLFNTQDIAIYNQSFWNAIKGSPFTSNTYGSNLACHNTWFFYLILPFYYLIPHPLTLFYIKSLLISAGTIPLLLLAQQQFKTHKYNFIICLIYLFYPAILSQNFGPPHEISFAPFFLLFTFYFFKKKNLKLFLTFLIISLTIKEQVFAVSVMFGILALLRKYEKKWIIIPIVLGISWFIFSILSLHHFKILYPADHEPAWIIAYFKNIIFNKNSVLLKLMNIRNLYWTSFYLKSFLATLAFLPLFSFTSVLCLPEAALNLILANTEVISPLRHYNVTVSCFLICAFIESLAKFKFDKRIKSIILILILAINISMLKQQKLFFNSRFDITKKNAVNNAIKIIPPTASLTCDRRFAPQVSSRKNLYIRELVTEYKTTYILSDISSNDNLPATNRYDIIFQKDHITVYKKSRSAN